MQVYFHEKFKLCNMCTFFISTFLVRHMYSEVLCYSLMLASIILSLFLNDECPTNLSARTARTRRASAWRRRRVSTSPGKRRRPHRKVTRSEKWILIVWDKITYDTITDVFLYLFYIFIFYCFQLMFVLTCGVKMLYFL